MASRTTRNSAITFFVKSAGRDVRRDQQRRGAARLATAESEAAARGWRTEWSGDTATLRDGERVLAEMAIDCDRNYRRVVEAELALEALAEEKR